MTESQKQHQRRTPGPTADPLPVEKPPRQEDTIGVWTVKEFKARQRAKKTSPSIDKLAKRLKD
jgi:hypothetical protein